jgi:hypothetical protein
MNFRYREGNPTTQMPALGRLEPVAAATRLVAKRSRERLQDRRTMVEKLFVRNGTESLPETAMDSGGLKANK